MLRYSLYLLMTTFKKMTTYIIPLLFIIVFGGLLMLQIYSNKKSYSEIFYLPDFFFFIPFLLGPLYMGAKTINIFKDGEEDGTELLIFSRPIERYKIITSKFLIIMFHMLFFSTIVFMTALLAGLADLSRISTHEVFLFAASVFIGSFIIDVVMTSLIMLAAAITSKLGAVIVSSAVPFLFIVISAIILPISKGTTGINQERIYIYSEKMQNTKTQMIKTGSPNIIDPYNGWGIKRQKEGWYKYIKYLDLYQHLQPFYKLFLPDVMEPMSAGELKEVKVKMESDIKFHGVDINGKPTEFIYAPTLYDHLPELNTVFAFLIKNRKIVSSSIYDYMLEMYKTKTVSTQEEKNVHNWLEPSLMSNPHVVSEGELTTQRFKINMKYIVKDFLMKLQKTPTRANPWVREVIKKETHVTLTNATISEKLKQLQNAKWLNSNDSPITMFISLMVSQGIENKRSDLSSYQGLEKELLQNFQPLLTTGTYKSAGGTVLVARSMEVNNLFVPGTIVARIQVRHWIPLREIIMGWSIFAFILILITTFRYIYKDFK